MTWQDRARAAFGAAPWLLIIWFIMLALQALTAGATTVDPSPIGAAPAAIPARPRTASMAIVDDELVYGPSAADFDSAAFVAERGGALAGYEEAHGDGMRVAGDIVTAVAEDHSVSPRVLLVMLQLATGVVDGGDAAAMAAPLGDAVAAAHGTGLRTALGWLASVMNAGYYGVRLEGITTVMLADGSAWTAPPPAGAGQVAVAAALAALDPTSHLPTRLAEFAALYAHWFGPLPDDRRRAAAAAFPPLLLPWAEGDTWHFTGGPHEAWGPGTPLGAIDFAPPDPNGCRVAADFALAAAPGVIVVSRDGYVLLDLDGDGFAGTGPVLQYLHMADFERTPSGARLTAGAPIGHPSCEGGFATGSHLHLARRLDGEWLPAVGGPVPLVLSDWRFQGGDLPYEGRMVHHLDGTRSALRRRNGDATGARSDNGPTSQAALSAAWASFAASAPAALASYASPESAALASSIGVVPSSLSAPRSASSIDGPTTAASTQASGWLDDEPAFVGAAASGGIDGSPPAPGAQPTLIVRLRLGGREQHDTAFALALTGLDGAVVPLVGHTDALGVSLPLLLPPGLVGVFDLVLRVPGFVEAHAVGVPLGDGPVDVDLTAGGAVALRPGDLDGDGDIDPADLVAWASAARRGLREADLDASGGPTAVDLWRVVAGLGAHR